MCIEKDRTAVRQVSPAKNTIEIDNKTVTSVPKLKGIGSKSQLDSSYEN